MDPFIPVPPDHYGGIERVIFDIANQYYQMGHRVTIVAGPNSQSPDRLITYGENGPLNASIDVKILIQVYRILLREVKNHDVIHNFGRLAFLLPVLKKNIRKVQTYMRFINKSNIGKYDFLAPKNLCYTAVSNAIAATGKTERSTWKTIYNCAPLQSFEFNTSTSPNGYLAFLGRIERCKGLHNAIEVAKRTNKELVIAGNISELPAEKLYFEETIKPQIDGKQIKYIGPVNNVQKNQLLGNASALLTPVEWFEPFPIIIPEAYACGTPVLGFNQGGIPEGIEHGETGFISSSVEEMAEHVQLLNRIERSKCREYSEKYFSDTKIANDYLNVYQSK